jgi:hypothetical protein
MIMKMAGREDLQLEVVSKQHSGLHISNENKEFARSEINA